MAETRDYSYQVRFYDADHPALIRLSKGSIQAFHPGEPGEWEESPNLYAMWYGGGPFMDYDDCTEEEALKYMEIIRENVRKLKAKRAGKA